MRFIHSFLWLPLSGVGAWHRLTLSWEMGLGTFPLLFTHFLNNLSTRAKNKRRKIFKDTTQEIFQKMRNFISIFKRHNIFRNKLFKMIAIKNIIVNQENNSSCIHRGKGKGVSGWERFVKSCCVQPFPQQFSKQWMKEKCPQTCS